MPSHINRAEAIGVASAAVGVLVAFLPWYAYSAGTAQVSVNAFRASVLGDVFFIAIAAVVLLLLIGRGFVDDVITPYIPESAAYATASAAGDGQRAHSDDPGEGNRTLPRHRHLSGLGCGGRTLHRSSAAPVASRSSPASSRRPFPRGPDYSIIQPTALGGRGAPDQRRCHTQQLIHAGRNTRTNGQHPD